MKLKRINRTITTSVVLTAFVACGDELVVDNDTNAPGASVFDQCDIDTNFVYGLLPRDGIQSIDNPQWVRANAGAPSYLDPEVRVIGIETGPGNAFAIPHSVLWHHEVVNMRVGDEKLAVSYCPLTGSSLVFDRSAIGGAELGVSGVLFMNNLIMYDRRDPEASLWPQMLAEARCGPGNGTTLTQYPFVEMTWDAWQQLHPDTWVLADADVQGFDPAEFDYRIFGYPYGPYETIPAFFTGLMPPIDGRRFGKERVIGVPARGASAAIAFPFGALEEGPGSHEIVTFAFDDSEKILLWSDLAEGGMVFESHTLTGMPVSLVATLSGFEDEDTGSSWTVTGEAVSGPMAGERLAPVPEAYTAFWGAWAAFHPETQIWEG